MPFWANMNVALGLVSYPCTDVTTLRKNPTKPLTNVNTTSLKLLVSHIFDDYHATHDTVLSNLLFTYGYAFS